MLFLELPKSIPKDFMQHDIFIKHVIKQRLSLMQEAPFLQRSFTTENISRHKKDAALQQRSRVT